MSFMEFKKCCFCVDLRAGSFTIGYVMLFLRLGTLAITSIRLASQNALMHHHGIEIRSGDVAFHRLIEIISLMVLVFEILLCIALLVGLHKRLDQHVEMYYVGSFAFLVIGVILSAVVLFRYAKLFGAWGWAIVAVEIFLKLILLYFLLVIRSYYIKMTEEEKGSQEELHARETAKTYFSRTKPTLFSSKP